MLVSSLVWNLIHPAFLLPSHLLMCASHIYNQDGTPACLWSYCLHDFGCLCVHCMLHRTHRTFILLHSCLTRSDKHIVTVVVQQAVVSSNQSRAPEKLETHETAIQGFWIVKPLWRLWGIFTKITEFCEQCWQQSLAQPLTMMKHCRNERCPAPRRETMKGYDERVSPAPWVWRAAGEDYSGDGLC